MFDVTNGAIFWNLPFLFHFYLGPPKTFLAVTSTVLLNHCLTILPTAPWSYHVHWIDVAALLSQDCLWFYIHLSYTPHNISFQVRKHSGFLVSVFTFCTQFPLPIITLILPLSSCSSSSTFFWHNLELRISSLKILWQDHKISSLNTVSKYSESVSFSTFISCIFILEIKSQVDYCSPTPTFSDVPLLVCWKCSFLCDPQSGQEGRFYL